MASRACEEPSIPTHAGSSLPDDSSWVDLDDSGPVGEVIDDRDHGGGPGGPGEGGDLVRTAAVDLHSEPGQVGATLPGRGEEGTVGVEAVWPTVEGRLRFEGDVARKVLHLGRGHVRRVGDHQVGG